MANGGKRPGAGRKKGQKAKSTLDAIQLKEALIAKYREYADPINKALIDKAMTGDIQAIREVHDRVYGRSKESLDIGNAQKLPFLITVVRHESGNENG